MAVALVLLQTVLTAVVAAFIACVCVPIHGVLSWLSCRLGRHTRFDYPSRGGTIEYVVDAPPLLPRTVVC